MKKSGFARPLALIKLIPNFITLSAVMTGIMGVRFAIDQKWEFAVSCIVIAAVLDGFDGRIARLLNATSPFGAQLDSLCDFASFGVCTGIIVYLWLMQTNFIKLLSWSAVSLFVISMAIRLARFNTNFNLNDNKLMRDFFMGIPAPCSAILALMPIILELDFADILEIKIIDYKLTIILYLFVLSFFTVSRVPTFSLKNVYIKPEYIWIFLISFSILMLLVILYPWYTIPCLSIVYMFTIPCSAVVAYKKTEQLQVNSI